MSDDVSILAVPQRSYALSDGGEWALRLDRNGSSLETALAIWAKGSASGAIASRDLVAPAPEFPQDAAFWDGLFALLDAGLLRHPEWLRDDAPADAPLGNTALTALRGFARSLRIDQVDGNPHARCSGCGSWDYSWTKRACQHAEVLRPALRRGILDEPGLLFEHLRLVQAVVPRYAESTWRYVLAPAAELIARRVGAVSRPVWTDFRRGRTPWRPRGASLGTVSQAVRFACDAWDLPTTVTPAVGAKDAPPHTLDLDAPVDERFEVSVLGMAEAEPETPE